MAVYSHFVGRIGKDGAQIKESKSGKGKFIVMDVATDYYTRGEDKTMWVKVISSMDRHVEKLAPHLTKGKLIIVEGQQVEPDSWIGTKDGQAHAQVVIIANLIDFVRVGKRQEAAPAGTQGQTVTTENAGQDANPFPAPEGKTDDLPF